MVYDGFDRDVRRALVGRLLLDDVEARCESDSRELGLESAPTDTGCNTASSAEMRRRLAPATGRGDCTTLEYKSEGGVL